MPDLDDLLDDGIARYARDTARPSDVDTLLRRGAVRRRRAHVRLVTTAVLAVAVIIGAGVAGLGHDDSDSGGPAPAPVTRHTGSPEVPLGKLTPAQIVHADDAELQSLAVSDTDPSVRASVWSLCANKRCGKHRMALTVTENGFDTTEYVDIPGAGSYAELEPLDGGSFFVSAPRLRGVLSTDGHITPLRRTPDPAPLAPDETLIPNGIAVAADGAAHRLSVPADTYSVVPQAGGRIVGYKTTGPKTTAIWSDDGGATWNEHPLPGHAGYLFQTVESADPDTLAIVEGGDGATLFPFETLHVSRDGGATWTRIPAFTPNDARGYLAWAFVRPDGELLVELDVWSDDQGRDPSGRSRGPYLSDGLDWSRMTPSRPGVPDEDDNMPPMLQSATYDGADVTLYISDGAEAYSSTDGGESWEPIAAR